MNVSSLALGVIFLSLGTVFVAQSKKDGTDDTTRRNYRFAGSMMMVAAVAFLFAFALSVVLGSGE
jgi:hypothetical protein